MRVIDVNALTKDYGSGRGVFDVSFHVDQGEVFGFLGPNGAGKTTTIRHILGFIKPQEGRAEVDGLDCWRCPDHSAYAPWKSHHVYETSYSLCHLT